MDEYRIYVSNRTADVAIGRQVPIASAVQVAHAATKRSALAAMHRLANGAADYCAVAVTDSDATVLAVEQGAVIS